ncbi:MAG TPA: PLD nuclease N-terminal domain-containing protein [Chryseosolibacter sp.]
MARLLSFLILVIDILVIIDILRSNKDTERKILWIIAVVFLPILGPILYFYIGRK